MRVSIARAVKKGYITSSLKKDGSNMTQRKFLPMLKREADRLQKTVKRYEAKLETVKEDLATIQELMTQAEASK